ncbi:MAG: family 78 glycoside hydrolase catalytic domain, partial [Proteobacteria bacterium]|nr:family 78 glycoside hydrolase catalytic domain [Pseudomonadota bacterium]
MTASQPMNLRCEYQENPLGLETEIPRFSWNLQSSNRSEKQLAYRILVSTRKEDLENEAGSMWDSGRVESDNTVNIEYAGSPLAGHQRYFWCVRWWDVENAASTYSEINDFTTGFFKDESWEAKWLSMTDPRSFMSNVAMIMQSGKHPQFHAVYLRKPFAIGPGVKFAHCCVSGMGYYELSLNGRKVGDHLLDPGQTDYKQCALYSSFDVTDLLREGNNAVGMILGNGRHIKAYEYGKPRGIFQLFVEYEDGSRDTVLSDGDWKTAHGPIMENGMYFGERYDARREMPGWNTFDFDDSDWEQVEVVDGPPLGAQTSPPIRASRTLKPKRIHTLESDMYVYDFGQNYTGWVSLSVEGPAGTEVKLRFSELVNDDCTLHRKTLRLAEATEVYVLKGIGREVYEPSFTYHGFRYVEITGYPGTPDLDTIEGRFVHSDVKQVGTLQCSNALINAVHQNIYWGQLSNLMSIPTDCPQREERMGWMGDAQLACEESFYNFHMVSFYSKYLNDIRQAQKEDGSLSDVIPTYWAIYPADPAWGSAYITIAWYCYLFTGDTRILEDHFEGMKRYVGFMRNSTDDFIIKTLGKFGDWCPPGSILPTKTPVELTSTWYFYHDTLLLSRMADVLNKKEDYGELAELAEQIKLAFNREFLQNGRYSTINNGILTDIYMSQTSQTLPLYLDMVPDDQKQQALENLETAVVSQSDCHVDTGIVGPRYLFDVLTENGLADVAYKVATQRTYPGFGYMI